VLTAYLDESKQEQLGIFAIGGYLFTAEGARRFEEEWARALQSSTPPLTRFHMNQWENKKRAYATWSEDFRIEFFGRLKDIIKSTASWAATVAIDLRAFANLSAEDKAVLASNTPYSLTFIHCLDAMAEGARVLDCHDAIAYVFDRMEARKAQLIREFELRKNPDSELGRGLSLDTLSWADSVIVSELQAADILIYEATKETAYELGRSTRPVRRSARSLIGGQTGPIGAYRVIDSAALRNLVAKNRGSLRETQ
jgi:hypothetical protein